MEKMYYLARRNNFDQNLDYQLLSLLNDCVDDTNNSPDTNIEEIEAMDEVLTSTFTPVSVEAKEDEISDEKIHEASPVKTQKCIYIIIMLIVACGVAVLFYKLIINNDNVSEQSSQEKPDTSYMSSTVPVDTKCVQNSNETTANTITNDFENSYSSTDSNGMDSSIEKETETTARFTSDSNQWNIQHINDDTTINFNVDIQNEANNN